jgi:hypothetical protein
VGETARHACARRERDATHRRRLRTSTNPSAVRFPARLAIAVAISCLAILACVDANAQVEIPASVDAYASAMAELLKERGKRPIEPVFEGGMQAAPELQAVLPDLSESQ